MVSNMVKYCYDYQSYFCHFGASTTTHMYDSRKEAEKDMSWAFSHNDDAYVSNVYKKVIITKEEKQLQEKRAAEKAKRSFNYKLDSQAYGVITFWDGSKDIFFVTEERNTYGNMCRKICFLMCKEKYNFYDFVENDRISGKDCSLWFAKPLPKPVIDDLPW